MTPDGVHCCEVQLLKKGVVVREYRAYGTFEQVKQAANSWAPLEEADEFVITSIKELPLGTSKAD